MPVPMWVLVLFALWAITLAATYVLIAKWGGAHRRTSLKVFAFTIVGTLVAALGVAALYARSHAAAKTPASASQTSGCDSPPAPPPTPAPAPSQPSTPAQTASSTSASSKAQPNFVTFAACGDGTKAPAKPAPR